MIHLCGGHKGEARIEQVYSLFNMHMQNIQYVVCACKYFH